MEGGGGGGGEGGREGGRERMRERWRGCGGGGWLVYITP